jgi:hypothetical protein
MLNPGIRWFPKLSEESLSFYFLPIRLSPETIRSKKKVGFIVQCCGSGMFYHGSGSWIPKAHPGSYWT